MYGPVAKGTERIEYALQAVFSSPRDLPELGLFIWREC